MIWEGYDVTPNIRHHAHAAAPTTPWKAALYIVNSSSNGGVRHAGAKLATSLPAAPC